MEYSAMDTGSKSNAMDTCSSTTITPTMSLSWSVSVSDFIQPRYEVKSEEDITTTIKQTINDLKQIFTSLDQSNIVKVASSNGWDVDLTSIALAEPTDDMYDSVLDQTQCTVCKKERSETQLTGLASCKHWLCVSCWPIYIKTKVVDEKQFIITCPICSALVPHDLIEFYTKSNNCYDAYSHSLFANFISAKKIKYCNKFPICRRLYEFKEQNPRNRFVRCDCNSVFCFSCNLSSDICQCDLFNVCCDNCKVIHAPLTCILYKKWEHIKNEYRPLPPESDAIRNCPTCSNKVTKEPKCIHMNCKDCRFEFCYLCNKKWIGYGVNHDCIHKILFPRDNFFYEFSVQLSLLERDKEVFKKNAELCVGNPHHALIRASRVLHYGRTYLANLYILFYFITTHSNGIIATDLEFPSWEEPYLVQYIDTLMNAVLKARSLTDENSAALSVTVEIVLKLIKRNMERAQDFMKIYNFNSTIQETPQELLNPEIVNLSKSMQEAILKAFISDGIVPSDSDSIQLFQMALQNSIQESTIAYSNVDDDNTPLPIQRMIPDKT